MTQTTTSTATVSHATGDVEQDKATSSPSSSVTFGMTIVYVPDVKASVEFFEAAFGLTRRYLDPEGRYGDMETGSTKLAFCATRVADEKVNGGVVVAGSSERPLGIEICLVTDDVKRLHERALTAGARELHVPYMQPWGEVSALRTPDGCLVQLYKPVCGVSA